MNTQKLKHVFLISLIASLLAITGCEEKGPLEKAGETIDDAVNDSGDALEDAADDVEDAADDAARGAPTTR